MSALPLLLVTHHAVNGGSRIRADGRRVEARTLRGPLQVDVEPGRQLASGFELLKPTVV